MRTRVPLVLATLAALLGAPSFASAAANALGAPSASPTTGSVTTLFTVSVTYDGKFPATVVSVSVAGISLPMTRTGGTPLQGTWSVSTRLPAGTWIPTFSSTSERGNAAVVVGPPISVDGPLPAPGWEPTGSGPSPRSGDIDSGGPGASGTSVDPGDPSDPVTAPAADASELERSAAADPVTPHASEPVPGGEAGGRRDGGTAAPEGPAAPAASPAGGGPGGGGDEPASDVPSTAGPDGRAGMPAADKSGDQEPPSAFVENNLLNAVLLIGLSGVAAVAVIGTALLILGGRRAPTTDEAPPGPTGRTDTEALLERRTLRQARTRLPVDPIVSTMGVSDQVAARRLRRRADQVGGGTGERPTQERR
jgi:hypothetical protein